MALPCSLLLAFAQACSHLFERILFALISPIKLVESRRHGKRKIVKVKRGGS